MEVSCYFSFIEIDKINTFITRRHPLVAMGEGIVRLPRKWLG